MMSQFFLLILSYLWTAFICLQSQHDRYYCNFPWHFEFTVSDSVMYYTGICKSNLIYSINSVHFPGTVHWAAHNRASTLGCYGTSLPLDQRYFSYSNVKIRVRTEQNHIRLRTEWKQNNTNTAGFVSGTTVSCFVNCAILGIGESYNTHPLHHWRLSHILSSKLAHQQRW